MLVHDCIVFIIAYALIPVLWFEIVRHRAAMAVEARLVHVCDCLFLYTLLWFNTSAGGESGVFISTCVQ